MAKTYITWIQRKVDHKSITHIKPVMEHNWKDKVTCTELGFGRVTGDPRELAVLETDLWAQINAVQPEGDTIFDRIKASCDGFYIKPCTAEEALAYCNEWYPPAEGDSDYFSLDVDGFTIIDNRPVEELI